MGRRDRAKNEAARDYEQRTAQLGEGENLCGSGVLISIPPPSFSSFFHTFPRLSPGRGEQPGTASGKEKKT